MHSSPTCIVARAGPADVGTLVALMREFYAESGYSLDEPWAAASFSQLVARPDLGCVWLAKHEDRAVGHAVLTLRYTMEHGALSGYVDDLYVQPPFRRQGVARALLAELVNECERRGGKALYVEVGENNKPALALYHDLGLAPLTDGRVLLHGALPASKLTGERGDSSG